MRSLVSSLTQLSVSLFVSVLVGVGVGGMMSLAANGFVKAVSTATELRERFESSPLVLFDLPFSFMPLIFLCVAAVIISTIKGILKVPRWHGPADSIYAAHRTDNEINIKFGLSSTFVAMVSASGGASVGQYGPIVHFGATIGSIIRRFAIKTYTTDVFIGCGVAAGIAAAFGAPIAGIIFAHEAIIRHFSMRAIIPISIASISSVWFSDLMFENEIVFGFVGTNFDLAKFAPIALVSGPLFGLIAVVFMMSVRKCVRLNAALTCSPLWVCLTAAVFVGLMGGFVPQVLGLGTDFIEAISKPEYAIGFLVVLLFLKILATSVCLGFGLFGGIFSPAIFIGATAGALMGELIVPIVGPIDTAAIAFLGIAAIGSAVIGAPITGVLIILELTMSYELALCAMLCVVSSVFVSNFLYGHSFFDRQLLDRGIDISKGRSQIEMTETPVMGIVSQDFTKLSSSDDTRAILKKLLGRNSTEGYLVDADNKLIGKTTLVEAYRSLEAGSARPDFDPSPKSIKHDASLQQAIEVASDFVGESIPVVERKTGLLLGVLSEADLLALYLSLQTKVADLERS